MVIRLVRRHLAMDHTDASVNHSQKDANSCRLDVLENTLKDVAKKVYI